MSDIFNEVDEELRRERFRELWHRYGGLVIGVALLIVVGIGGWRGYEWWQVRQAAEAGAVFEQAVILASEGKYNEAEAAFGRIADEGSAYRVLARLRQASELARTDRDGAVKIYDALAADSRLPAVMQDLARVRAGLLLIDTASLEQMRERLEPVTAAGRTFRHSARELMAFSAWRGGSPTATKQWVDAIVADPETPVGVRNRTDILMALSATDARS